MSAAPDAAHALAAALSTSVCTPGQCLRYTRTWLGIPAYYPDAATAWAKAKARHPADRTPPIGAPVFYAGGKHGHIALYLGSGKIHTTDAPSAGRVTTQALTWPETHWGFTYSGWSEDLNTVTLPYLEDAMPTAAEVAEAVWDQPIRPDVTLEDTIKARAMLRRTYRAVRAIAEGVSEAGVAGLDRADVKAALAELLREGVDSA